MISNYFTLSALAREWAELFAGSVIRDAYSPLKDELTIELSTGDAVQAIRISVRPGFHFVYRAERTGRPRSNVTTLFEDAIGSSVKTVVMNPTDRILSLGLNGSERIDVHLYGSRANVFLIGGDAGEGLILEAFKRSGEQEGESPPTAKSLPDVDLKETLTKDAARTSLDKRLARLRPRFGKALIREVIFRSGIDPGIAAPLSPDDAHRVESALRSVSEELASPSSRIYRSDDDEIFSLVSLAHLETEPDQVFDSVDEGVRWVVRERTRGARLEEAKRPLVKPLERAVEKARKKVLDLEKAIAAESRADQYERWGHLLMANPKADIKGDSLTVRDILGDGGEISIPVKSDLSVIENAERFYSRARNLRAERATLEERVTGARHDLRTLIRLLREVVSTEDARDVERFRKSNSEALRRYIGGRGEGAPAPVPFRRFKVSGGFDVWVGRNARENDRLTFDAASPHDLWFHARGAAGSHVVLRVPGRKTVVPKPVRAEVAAIAAWFSSLRGSNLVPVIVTERKYVSKPKGSDPGAVRVHREEVLMVEPGLPG